MRALVWSITNLSSRSWKNMSQWSVDSRTAPQSTRGYFLALHWPYKRRSAGRGAEQRGLASEVARGDTQRATYLWLQRGAGGGHLLGRNQDRKLGRPTERSLWCGLSDRWRLGPEEGEASRLGLARSCLGP